MYYLQAKTDTPVGWLTDELIALVWNLLNLLVNGSKTAGSLLQLKLIHSQAIDLSSKAQFISRSQVRTSARQI